MAANGSLVDPAVEFCDVDAPLRVREEIISQGKWPIVSFWGWVFAPRFGSDSAATIERDRRHSPAMSRILRLRSG